MAKTILQSTTMWKPISISVIRNGMVNHWRLNRVKNAEIFRAAVKSTLLRPVLSAGKFLASVRSHHQTLVLCAEKLHVFAGDAKKLRSNWPTAKSG